MTREVKRKVGGVAILVAVVGYFVSLFALDNTPTARHIVEVVAVLIGVPGVILFWRTRPEV
jgi:hypothetical protein